MPMIHRKAFFDIDGRGEASVRHHRAGEAVSMPLSAIMRINTGNTCLLSDEIGRMLAWEFIPNDLSFQEEEA